MVERSTYLCHETTDGRQVYLMVEMGLLTSVMRSPMVETGLLNDRDGSIYLCRETTHGRNRST